MDGVSSCSAGPSSSSTPLSENEEGLHSEVRATLAHLVGKYLPLVEQQRVCHALGVERMEPTDFLEDLLKFKKHLCRMSRNFKGEKLLPLEEFISTLAGIATKPSTGVERECAMFKELITLDQETFNHLLEKCGREHKILKHILLYREFVYPLTNSKTRLGKEVGRCAERGQFQFALMLSDVIQEPYWKKEFMYKFCMTLVEQQHEIQTAAEMVPKIPDFLRQIMIMRQICNILIEEGDLKGAFILLEKYLKSREGLLIEHREIGLYKGIIENIAHNFARQGRLDMVEKITLLVGNQAAKDACYEVLCNVYIEHIKEISETGAVDVETAFAPIDLSRQIEGEGLKRKIRDKTIAVMAVTVCEDEIKRDLVGSFISDPEDLERTLEILRLAHEGKLMEIEEIGREFSNEEHRNIALRAASRIFLEKEEIQREDVQRACYFIEAFGQIGEGERIGWLTELIARKLGQRYSEFQDLIPPF